jgi:hypothetical protein
MKSPDAYDDESIIMALADDGLLEERKKDAQYANDENNATTCVRKIMTLADKFYKIAVEIKPK